MLYAIYRFKITLEKGKTKCECSAWDDEVHIGIIEASTDEEAENKLGFRLMRVGHGMSSKDKSLKQGWKLYFPACLGNFDTIFMLMQIMLKRQKKTLYTVVTVYGYEMRCTKLLNASDVNSFKDWKQSAEPE